MRQRIVYVLVIGALLFGVSGGHGQAGGPGGQISNSSAFVTKMGSTYIGPTGFCGLNANTIDPKVTVEYGTVDAMGKQTMIGSNIGTSLTKQANGSYIWSGNDIGPVQAGTTYYVKATLKGRLNGMPPGPQVELASNTVNLYP